MDASEISEVIAASMNSLGILVNAFITVTMVLDWLDSRKMKPYDKLLMSLGLSRVFLLFCFLFRIVNRICEFNSFPSDLARWFFRTAQLFFDFSNLWFSMWHCVIYYVKISIVKNTLLLRFKLSIPQIVSPIIAASSVISLSSGFIFAFTIKETSDVMDTVYVPVNESFSKDLKFVLPCYFFGHVVPFVIASISNFLLIATISVHIRHVKKNITSFSTPSLDAHITAIRSVCLMQLLNICNLIGTILFRFDFCKSIEKDITFLILNFYPTLHSMVFITGNAKLKRTFYRIVDCARKFCKMEKFTSAHGQETKTETVGQQNGVPKNCWKPKNATS